MAVRINKADFEEKVLKSDLPVIVDFYSDSCIACKKLAPVLGDVEDDYEGKLYVYKVNTNFDKELAKEYQIAANPTLLFVKNAEVLDRKIGAHTLAELKTWVEALLYNMGQEEDTMIIVVSGEKKEVKDNLTLPELIEQENVEMPEYVTVSINEEFVPSDEKETTVLKEGDVVEFLYFMGGGC